MAASSAPLASLAAIVDPLVARSMSANSLPGVTLALARGGTVLYARGYGYADIATCRPAQADTAYQIGSVTKQFTAAAILRLQAAGSLDIDKPASAYLASDPPFDPRITVRMLLNQLSGLQDYTDFADYDSWAATGVAEGTALDQVAGTPLLFEPGSAYSYSNSNYFALGAILEAVTSTPYAGNLGTTVFQPLGLTQTSNLPPPQAAVAYTYKEASDPAAGLFVGTVPDPSASFAAGALWSSALDLAAWDAALVEGRVIPAAEFAEMVTPPASVPTFPATSPPTDSTYAMGWGRVGVQGHPAVNHLGGTPGFSSSNTIVLESGVSLSLLTNAGAAGPALSTLTKEILDGVCAAGAAGAC